MALLGLGLPRIARLLPTRFRAAPPVEWVRVDAHLALFLVRLDGDRCDQPSNAGGIDAIPKPLQSSQAC